MNRNVFWFSCSTLASIGLGGGVAVAEVSQPAQRSTEAALTIEQGGRSTSLSLTLGQDRQARLTLKDAQGNLLGEATTDGTTLTQLTKGPDGKTYWRQTPLGGQYSTFGQLNALSRAPGRSGGGDESQPFSLAHPSPALAVIQTAGVLSEEAQMLLLGYDPAVLLKKQGRLISASKLEKLTLGKEPVTIQTLIVRDDPLSPGAPEPVNYQSPRQRLTIARAVKDGTLRQLVSVREGGRAKAETTTLTVTKITHSASIPASRFAFTPPPGAIRVGAPTPTLRATAPAPQAPALPPSALRIEGESKHDFGKASFRDAAKATKVFTVRNAGDRPLTLTPPRPTCPCLSGKYLGEGGTRIDTLTLAPGQSARVEATLDFTGLRSGPLTKSLLLYSDDGKASAMVTLSADLLMPVTFDPPLLDFTSARSGAAMSATLRATIDARMLKGGEPTLQSDGGGILQLVPVPPVGSPSSGPAVVRTWRVTLPADAPLGLVRATLSLKPPAGASQADAAQWRSASVTTVGQVSGAISASPNIFLFAATPIPGPPLVFRTELKTEKPDPALFKGMTATVEGENVKGLTVKAVEGARSSIELLVAPTAPPGQLAGRVVVKLADGKKLLIPIQGTLSAPPK